MVIYNRINFIHVGVYPLCFFSLCLSSCPIKGNRSSTELLSEHSTAHCAITPLYLRENTPCSSDLERFFWAFSLLFLLILPFPNKFPYQPTITEHSSPALQVEKRVKNPLSVSRSPLQTVRRNGMVANLFAMHSDCTGVLFCLTGRWDQRGAGQKGLSSDLSGDERQPCLGKWLQPRTSLQITNRLKKSWHEKKYSKKGSKVSFIWFGLLVPPFKPKSKKGGERTG